MAPITRRIFAALSALALYSAIADANPYPFAGYGPQGSTPPFWFQGMPSFQAMGGGSSFMVTTNELPQGYQINLFLRGIEPREVTMRILGNMLVLERTSANAQSGMGGFVFGASTFNWSVPLPADADLAGINGRIQPEGIQLFIPRRR